MGKSVKKMNNAELIAHIETLDKQIADLSAGDSAKVIVEKDTEIKTLKATIAEKDSLIEELSKSNASAGNVGLDHFTHEEKVYKLISKKFSFKGQTITMEAVKADTALIAALVEAKLAVEVK